MSSTGAPRKGHDKLIEPERQIRPALKATVFGRRRVNRSVELSRLRGRGFDILGPL